MRKLLMFSVALAGLSFATAYAQDSGSSPGGMSTPAPSTTYGTAASQAAHGTNATIPLTAPYNPQESQQSRVKSLQSGEESGSAAGDRGAGPAGGTH